MKFVPYNTNLTEKAKENRKNPTPAEKKIWFELLCGKQLKYKFTRQKPLRGFIVDYYCSELLLVIEVDGDSHSMKEEYDRKRTKKLEEFGIQVIRYSNREVLENLSGVYDDLMKRIEEQTKTVKPPSIPPLSGGASKQQVIP